MAISRTFNILCAGDVHLGRRSSRIPAASGTRDLSTTTGWFAFVDAAVSRRVNAVVLTGDVVDRENRFFEAFGPLLEGVRRLAEAGIEVFAVSGNHDFDVLHRLAEEQLSESFHLLGRGGDWGHAELRREGHLLARLHGWSLPAARHPESPLQGALLPASGEVPAIGLMHADLDQSDSPYAPVTSAELRSQPIDLWLLGHVHSPRIMEGRPMVCYPGSLQAMDPGEPGVHGALLIEGDAAANFKVAMLPLSPVRYELLPIDITECRSVADLEGRVAKKVKKSAQQVASESDSCRFLSLRLALQGRTPLHHRVDRSFVARIIEELRPSIGSLQTFVESIRMESRPAKDLNELAGGGGVVSELARIILVLQNRDATADLRELTESARRALDLVESAPAYSELPALAKDFDSTEAYVRELLLRQSARLLDALLDQKGE